MPADDGMDGADRAWLATMVPDGCVSEGFLAVITWFDNEGQRNVRYYNQLDADLSGCLGLLEMAKMDMIARTSGMWFSQSDSDDD